MDKENLSAQKDQVGGDHEHHHDHSSEDNSTVERITPQ